MKFQQVPVTQIHTNFRQPRRLRKWKKRADKKIPIGISGNFILQNSAASDTGWCYGSCGKSTVILFWPHFYAMFVKKYETQNLFIIDPESEDGILAHLKKIKSGDIVLVRIVDMILFRVWLVCASVRMWPSSRLSLQRIHTQILLSISWHIKHIINFIVASDEVIDATALRNFRNLEQKCYVPNDTYSGRLGIPRKRFPRLHC